MKSRRWSGSTCVDVPDLLVEVAVVVQGERVLAVGLDEHLHEREQELQVLLGGRQGEGVDGEGPVARARRGRRGRRTGGSGGGSCRPRSKMTV